MDSGSDVPTTRSRRQLWSSAVVVPSVSETSTVEEDNNEPHSSDDTTSDVWCKFDKIAGNEPFLGTTVLNIIIDSPEFVTDVVSSIIGDDRIQLLNEQSNLYHSWNAVNWEVS